MARFILLVLFIFFLTSFFTVICFNKYSEEAQVLAELRTNDRPFRMQKLNLVWEKARKRLSVDKLKMLQTELKIQDKEELTWKRIKSEGQDKDGLLETELRRKLRNILHRYDLVEHFSDVDKVEKAARDDTVVNEALDKNTDPLMFKDKKLVRLWEKAERSGFTEEELKMLKEEFQHHQEKIDDYYQFMDTAATNGETIEMDNSIEKALNASSSASSSKDKPHPKQALKEKHQELKRNYERLGKIASTGFPDKDFKEQKVAGLWKLAQNASFTPDELDSLKEELQHYEHRIRKLQHMAAQVELAETINKWTDDNAEDKKRMEQKIKQYGRKVEKIHVDLEGRILQRHLEL